MRGHEAERRAREEQDEGCRHGDPLREHAAAEDGGAEHHDEDQAFHVRSSVGVR